MVGELAMIMRGGGSKGAGIARVWAAKGGGKM